MAIKTVSFQRVRSELKTFSEATIGNLETSYSAYEAVKAADTTKTWTVRVINSFFDGVNFFLIAEASYPEINEDPTGQVPEIILP